MNSLVSDIPMKKARTGIIYFTRTIFKEARSKKWHPSFSTNLKIANYLIENTKEVLTQTGFDVIVIDEKAQRGNSFGEKITSAFEDVFLQGYESLVLIGNDTVGLTSECITESIKELSEKPVVCGSTVNKGLYVVGFQKSFFAENKEKISGLPWKTNLLADAASHLTELNTSSDLPELSDLNSTFDLQCILRYTFGSEPLVESLRTIVNGQDSLITANESDLIQLVSVRSKIKKRGPPSFRMK